MEETNKFSCGFCAKTFRFECRLKVHLIKHSGQRPFGCSGCENSYTTKHTLILHEKRMHPGLFQCNDCGVDCLNSDALEIHMKIHQENNLAEINDQINENNADDGTTDDDDEEETNKFSCRFCSKTFQFKCRLKNHLKVHTGQRPYPCSVCKNAYKTKHALRWHEEKSHPGHFTCNVCGEVCLNSSALKTHMKVHPESLSFVISEVENDTKPNDYNKDEEASNTIQHGSSNSYNLKDTINDVKRELKLELGDQHNLERDNSNNTIHIKEYKPDTGSFFEVITDIECNAEESETEFDYNDAGMETITCNYCLKTFKHKSRLKIHLRAHTGERPFPCSECENKYKSKHALNQHEEKTHPGHYKCQDCNENCLNSGALQIHMKIHEENLTETNVQSDQLNQNQPNITELEHNSKTSDDYKNTQEAATNMATSNTNYEDEAESTLNNMACNFCSKTFKNHSRLNIHLRIHTGERPFRCTECENSYTTKQALILHGKRIHPRLFQCNECGDDCLNSDALEIHMKIHQNNDQINENNVDDGTTDDKEETNKFSCGFCLKTFQFECRLKNHLKVHTGERPYPCSVCENAYKTKLALRGHEEKRHPGHFTCNVCGDVCLNSSALKIHMKIHPENLEFVISEVENDSKLSDNNNKDEEDTNTIQPGSSNCYDLKDTINYVKQELNLEHGDQHNHEHGNSNNTIHIKEYKADSGSFFEVITDIESNTEFDYNDAGMETVTCNYCLKTFKHKSRLKIHLRAHTGERPFPCSECENKYKSKHALNQHEEKTHPGHYKCQDCDEDCLNSGALQIHMKIHEENLTETNVQSDQLNQNQPNITELEHNSKTSEDYNITHKEEATNMAISNTDYEDEAEAESTLNGFICNFCSKTFQHQSRLNLHLRKHTAERPFPCSECENKYKSKHALNQHEEKTHPGHYKCQDCNENCLNSDALQIHMKENLTETKLNQNLTYVISELDNNSKTSVYNNKDEEATNTIQKGSSNCTELKDSINDINYEPYLKPVEQKDLENNSSNINIPIKEFNSDTNSAGEGDTDMKISKIESRTNVDNMANKIFTCDFCLKTFKHMCRLKFHLRTHSEERPYPCPKCENAYKSKYTLIKHEEKLHSGDFKCPDCEEDCLNSDALKNHIKIHHQENVTEVNIQQLNQSISFVISEMEYNSNKEEEKATNTIPDGPSNSYELNDSIQDVKCELSLKHLEQQNLDNDNFNHGVHIKENKSDIDSSNQNIAFVISELEDHSKTSDYNNKEEETEATNTNQHGTSNSYELKDSIKDINKYNLKSLDQHNLENDNNAVHIKENKSDIDSSQEGVTDMDTSRTEYIYDEDRSTADDTTKKIFTCDFCHKTFQHQCRLKLHLRKHTGERPYPCSGCENAYKSKYTLIKHEEKIHPGQFVCHDCDKDCLNSDALKIHMQIH